jgi:tetratricopeptide (TPR) repeat protein
MCQYLPLYQVGTKEARIIIKTFGAVFPHVTAWFAFNDMILIGSEEPLQIDFANLKKRIDQPGIAQDLREAAVDDAYDFLANYLFDEREISEIGEGLPLNTDDYPIIEYRTPRAVMKPTEYGNVNYFLGKRVAEFPGIVDMRSLPPAESDHFYSRMRKQFRARGHVIRAHLNLLGAGGDVMAELEKAEELAAPHTTASHYVAELLLSGARRLMVQKGEYEEATQLFRRAERRRPDHPETLRLLGRAMFMQGKRGQALNLFERSLLLDEAQIEPRIFIARSLIARRKFTRARDLLERCLELDPGNAVCTAGIESIADEAVD